MADAESLESEATEGCAGTSLHRAERATNKSLHIRNATQSMIFKRAGSWSVPKKSKIASAPSTSADLMTGSCPRRPKTKRETPSSSLSLFSATESKTTKVIRSTLTSCESSKPFRRRLEALENLRSTKACQHKHNKRRS
jgi:hypothetical protein